MYLCTILAIYAHILLSILLYLHAFCHHNVQIPVGITYAKCELTNPSITFLSFESTGILQWAMDKGVVEWITLAYE